MPTISRKSFTEYLEEVDKRTLYSASQPVAHPNLWLVVGQQGSGKSTMVGNLKKKYPNAVVLVPDDIFYSHDHYLRYVKTETPASPTKRADEHGLQAFTNILHDSMIERKNIIWENALVNDIIYKYVQNFKRADYKVHLIHINEYPIICKIATKSRYIDMLKEKHYARYVNNASIDTSVRNNRVLLKLQRKGFIDSYTGYEHNYANDGRGSFILNGNNLQENLQRFSKMPPPLSEGQKRYIQEQMNIIETYINDKNKYSAKQDQHRVEVLKDYNPTRQYIQQHYGEGIKKNNKLQWRRFW